MNWDAIAAIGQRLGAGGVIASVLFVASQVRPANRASAVTAKLSSTKMQNDFLDPLIANPALLELWFRGCKDLALLNEVQGQRFKFVCINAVTYHSCSYFQFRNRTLDDDTWTQVRTNLRLHCMGPGVQAWWRSTGHRQFGSAFCQFVDREKTDAAAERASRATETAEHSPSSGSTH